MKKQIQLIILIIIGVVITSCGQDLERKKDINFKFAYFTDTHLGEKDGKLDTIFREALRDAKSNDVDFVLLGGDYYHSDGFGVEKEKDVIANYTHLLNMVEEEGMKAYYTPGNHDRFYFHKGETSVIGHEMYKEVVGKLYYSFDYNGVHFIILNSCELTDNGEYYAIREQQIEWLKKELEKTGKETPIVVSLHVPLISIYHLVIEDGASPYSTIINSKEIVDLLDPYNLKVVLQGHNHIHEEILERGHWFVTGGATCGAWPSEIGYMLVEVDAKNDFSWEYIKFNDKK